MQLATNIEQQLARWGHCLLLDCHSFPDEPFAFEDDQGLPRPDICLGICRNTPRWLLDACMELFLQRGDSVGTDFPYSGCLVPQRFQGNPHVPAMMIEVNRRLYLKPAAREAYRLGNTPIKLGSFDSLKVDIWSVVLSLVQVIACRTGGRAGGSFRESGLLH